MNSAAARSYLARFRKVLKHIDAQLDEDLAVERLSGVAAFSKYHFHRQFTELFGISAGKYVQLCRLKRASFRLAFRSGSQIIDIALASGYEGPEAFARAFRKCFGQSPSGFRKQPRWHLWYATYQPLSELRINHMKPEHQADHVRIVDFEETNVATLEHRGDPKLLCDSIRKFIEWRKRNNLPPKLSATFKILYDDPAGTPPEDFRFDLCAATQRAVAPEASGIVGKTIPAGRCAVLRHTGSDDNLGESIAYLYSVWLPQSAEELRDFPLFLQRLSFFPEVAEHEAVVDIFLPLK